VQPISLHYSQHSLYPLLSQPACSSSSPIEVSRRCTHRTSSPSSATAAPTEPYPSSHQHRPHRQPQHRWEHRLPARSRQIFPLQPATGHGLPHQHRRDRASLIDCLWCFLGFAGDVVSHRQRGREEGGWSCDWPLLGCVSGSGAWVRQWRWRVGRRTATVQRPRNLPQYCSRRFQEALDFLGAVL